MAQNRKPPAYQEYAATILADRNFRLMTLAERGLFYSMRLECWENGNAPSIASELAKYLGFEVREVEIALTERVKAHFSIQDNSFICPEIEDYRKHIIEQKTKQREGGRKGAEKVNSMNKNNSNAVSGTPSGISSGNPRVTRESLVKSSLDKFSQVQSLDRDGYLNDWVEDYERASNGE